MYLVLLFRQYLEVFFSSQFLVYSRANPMAGKYMWYTSFICKYFLGLTLRPHQHQSVRVARSDVQGINPYWSIHPY